MCDIYQNLFSSAFNYVDTTIKLRLSSSVHSNPGVELYILKAKLYYAQGLIDLGNQTMVHCSTMSTRHPEVISFSERIYARAERLYNYSLYFFAKAMYEDCIKCLKSALVVTKYDSKLFIMISKVYRKTGDLNQAFSYIQQVKNILNIYNIIIFLNQLI